MKLLKIRHAQIDPKLREIFERYGVVGMQVVLGTTNYIVHEGQTKRAVEIQSPLLEWLSEQYDKVERREAWLLVMEIAITIFIAIELINSVFHVCSR